MVEQTDVNGKSPEAEGPRGVEDSVGEARGKAFVEPEVSFPIDVLEATTFFQLTDSGATT